MSSRKKSRSEGKLINNGLNSGNTIQRKRFFETIGKYIRSFSKDGLIDCEFRAKPNSKELMTAQSLAKNGHRVVFRKEIGGAENNPDSYVDGEICDFKRITSANKSKIYQRLEESNQAEFYVIDLRISKITEADAIEVADHAVKSDSVKARKVLLLFADGSEKQIKEAPSSPRFAHRS